MQAARRPIARALTGALLYLGLALPGCSFFPPLPIRTLDHYDDGRGGDWTVHRMSAPAIREASGLVKSRTYPDVFWTHNDSGDVPRIFAVGPRGQLIAEFAVKTGRQLSASPRTLPSNFDASTPGDTDARTASVKAFDWEDIAIDDSQNLYLGDIGNNLSRRKDLVVYRIREPDPFGRSRIAYADLALPFRYADSQHFPRGGWLNADAEALFWMSGDLYILTKHRCDRRSELYRLPIRAGADEVELLPMAEFHFAPQQAEGKAFDPSARGAINPQGNVTAADLHPDGERLAVLTYRALFLFQRERAGPAPFRYLRRIALGGSRTRQVESVAWDGDAIVIGNEQGWLFRIPDPVATPVDRYPP